MPEELIDQLMALAGEESASKEVDIVGADPILQTPFKLGEVGAAAIGAAGIEAARLLEMRTGKAQRVRVDIDAAAIGMRSYRYNRFEPEVGPPEPAQAVPDIYYPLDDGRWMYFQRLFPHHIRRQLDVLGLPHDADDEAMAKAVASWDGLVLEEAIVAAGATGAFVRTHEEWASHEQGKAVLSLPLFEIVKIGESDPEPIVGERPLSGIRVLDVTRVLAGPTVGRTLAEHGADVLRIGTSAFPDNPVMMRDLGHGKRSADLDLKSGPGIATLRRLAAGADVFSQGYRPGAIATLGFGPEELSDLRPGIIYVTESAFGHLGPWRDRRGFDSVVQAASGIGDELKTFNSAGKPHGNPATSLDFTTGYLGAFAVMVALKRRAEEGGSYEIRLSLAQTARWQSGAGRTDLAAAAARPEDVSPERLRELTVVRDTPFGRLRYLAPIAQLSGTPGYWERPTVPLNHDEPVWLDRPN